MKVGVIGCGKIAQVRHIPEYATNPDARLIGVYDRTAARAKEVAEQYDCRTFSTIEEMLACGEIDAVSICVANQLHAQIALESLKAGKHVLCEKPMATNMEDCEAMAKAAKENGKILMIAQNQRFAAAHVEAKKLISRGEIGKVLTFRTTFGHGGPETWSIHPGPETWFFDKKQAAMGAMADLGVHKTDLIQYLLDDTVAQITAKLTTLDKRDQNGEWISVDDNAICIYQMKSGVIGTMTASWTYYGEEDNSTVLYGTEGILKIYENPAYSLEVIRRNGGRVCYEIDQIQTNDHQTRSGIIDAFVEAVNTGSEPPVSAESVLSAMRAVFGSVESSKSGKTVVL